MKRDQQAGLERRPLREGSTGRSARHRRAGSSAAVMIGLIGEAESTLFGCAREGRSPGGPGPGRGIGVFGLTGLMVVVAVVLGRIARSASRSSSSGDSAPRLVNAIPMLAVMLISWSDESERLGQRGIEADGDRAGLGRVVEVFAQDHELVTGQTGQAVARSAALWSVVRPRPPAARCRRGARRCR